jgi:hypothetical protein
MGRPFAPVCEEVCGVGKPLSVLPGKCMAFNEAVWLGMCEPGAGPGVLAALHPAMLWSSE